MSLVKHFRFALLIAVCALSIGAFACGSSQSGAKSTMANQKLVCEHTQPTGSHIDRPVCYHKEQADDRRESDQEKVRRIQHMDALRPTNSQPRR